MSAHLIIWIGGAGDKYAFMGQGPTGLITSAMMQVGLWSKFVSHPSIDILEKVLGADEAPEGKTMKDYNAGINLAGTYRLMKPGDYTRIHIIAHSWGARLAVALCEVIDVDHLITLDPVGVVKYHHIKTKLGWVDNLFKPMPQFPGYHMGAPRAKTWYNVDAISAVHDRDASDWVSVAGGDWMDRPSVLFEGSKWFAPMPRWRTAKGEHRFLRTSHRQVRKMLVDTGFLTKLIDHILGVEAQEQAEKSKRSQDKTETPKEENAQSENG